jgi:hypothetical protein
MTAMTLWTWIFFTGNVACLVGGISMVVVLVREVGRWRRLTQALWSVLHISYGLQHSPRAMLLLACLLHDAQDAVWAMLRHLDTASE